MTASIVPIPFATGIDQSLSTVVGEPRITRMHNARLSAPGRVVISPGYLVGNPPSNLRAAVQDDEKLHMVGSTNGLFVVRSNSGSGTYTDASSYEAVKWSQPAFEAPTRINFPPATATWAAPRLDASSGEWLLLSIRALVGGEVASLFIMSGTTITQQVALSTSYTSDRYRLVTDSVMSMGVANGRLIKHNYTAHTISIYTVSTGSTPLAGPTVTNAAIASPMRDIVASHVSTVLYIAALQVDGNVVVLRNSSGSWAYFGSIAAGNTTIAIAANGTELLCLRNTGEAQTYDLQTLAARSSATATATPVSVMSLSKIISNGKFYFSLDVAHAATNDADSHCYSITGGTVSGPLTIAEVLYETPSAQPVAAPLVDDSSNVYQITMNHAAVSRSLQISRVYTDTPLRARHVVTAAHGEMPLVAAAALQGGLTSTYAAATPIRISNKDPLTGVNRTVYIVPSIYVSSGTLTETTSQTAGMAIVFAPDGTSVGNATTCMTGFDGLCTARTQYGRVFSCGAPFAVGARGISTGAAIDLPAPYVTQDDETAGTERFTSGQIYQYIVQYEYRSPDGTLFRGPPSQPITYHVINPSFPNTQINGLIVTLSLAPESPDMPGIRARLYRTENGGNVFYDTGATMNVTGNTYVLTDHCSDATLIGQQALTDGAAVSGGIKSRYGFPPHRCSWNGRDRVIVGGLENPRRVRWSLLNYPGEATAFPHPSEQGWSADVADDVTAVAQLDDAWIIFSRTHIWSIYGAGPDDNGMSGGFDPPRLISPNLGCVSWKSLAEVEGGLLFQGADGQIYMLQRGQLTVQWFSARVRDELNAGMLGTQLLNPIVAVIPHDAAQTIHFVRAPLPGGNSPLIIYDRRTDAWSTDGDSTVDGLNGAIGGASILDVFTGDTAPQTMCTITPTALVLENQTGVAHDPIGASWTAEVTTNDMAPFGFGGWGQVYRIGAIVETTGAFVAYVSQWMSRSYGAADAYGTFTYADTATDFPFYQWAPPKTKCSAQRLTISWNERAAALVGLVLSVEPSQGSQRLQTSRKA